MSAVFSLDVRTGCFVVCAGWFRKYILACGIFQIIFFVFRSYSRQHILTFDFKSNNLSLCRFLPLSIEPSLWHAITQFLCFTHPLLQISLFCIHFNALLPPPTRYRADVLVHICMYTQIYMCSNICKYICIYTYVYIYVYLFIHVCVCICIYIYVCIYRGDIYVYIYLHTYV